VALKAGCCTSDTEPQVLDTTTGGLKWICDDKDLCTYDKCTFGQCHHFPPSPQTKLYGIPETCCTTVSDCSDDGFACTVEACDFNDNLARLKKKDAIVLGVSFDDEKRHKKFIDKHSLGFDLLVDADKKAAKAYGVYQMKKFMGREFMGIVRSTFLIDEKSRIAKIWSPVSVKGHVADVLASTHT
jgi:peroxiredoxin